MIYPAKEAVLIDPKQERHISMQGAKSQPDAATPGSNGHGNKGPKQKKKKRFHPVRFILSLIGCIFCVGIMACSVGGVMISMYVVQVTANDDLDLDALVLAQTSLVYDKNGDEYARFTSGDNRIWRNLADMPENLQHAVIAVEDKDFMTEPGINIKRTIAAALNEFTGGKLLGNRQGASTLEQQLIKNLTGDDETDIMRKVREIFRALGLCKRYSKETVLEAYLNTIGLTGQLCGMEAGANTYFGKSVEDLTLSECAVMASITKNPKNYNPFTNPEMLMTRRDHVLKLMRDQGYITAEECAAAQAETITLVESKASSENATRSSNQSYFTDSLYESLISDIMEQKGETREGAKEMIFSGGLRIDSTVDPTIQTSMEKILLNEDNLFPALWHEESVDSKIPVGTEITYDEDGQPLNPDGTSIFGEDDEPIYTDDTNTVLKTGTDDTGAYICFYENVRTQAAMATLDYDGNILAVAGGIGEKKYDLGTNRATIPHQTGSTMKPIAAYCLALQNKLITYSTQLSDAPIYAKADHKVLDTDYCIRHGLSTDPYNATNQSRDDVWRDWPTNYGGAGGKGDPMLVFDALRRSYNTVAVWVGSMVGTENMFNFAHDTLNASYLDPETDMDLAPLVLGSQSHGMTVVELAGAYSIFNDGSYTTPHYYTTVYDSQGNLFLDNSKHITTTQAISQETATIMNRLLSNVLYDSQGTAYGRAPESDVGMDAAAKTGTTSDFRDYTFCGLTPYYVTAVWWGFDKPYSMYDLGGRDGKPTQYAWKYLMEDVQQGLAKKDFFFSENVQELHFDTSSGTIVSSGGGVGYYTADNLPGVVNTETTDDSYLQDAQNAADAANQQQAAETPPPADSGATSTVVTPTAPPPASSTTDTTGGIVIG